MKNHYLTLCFLLLSVHIAIAQSNSVTLKDGSNTVISTHDAIGAAYEVIPSTLTQAYLIELGPTYNGSLEVFPITLTARTGASSTNNITIRPAAGNLNCDTLFGTLTGSNSGIFSFNGATNVTIDGRPGGTGTMIGLAIVNTNAGSTAAPTIYMPATASNNTIKYVYTRTASVTNASTRNISLNGNGNNVENCFIYQCGLSVNACGIYMNSASKNINIINNKVVNCIRGIVSNLSDTVVVKGCEIYHTSAYTPQATAIGINPAFAGSWEISNNYIHDLKCSQVLYGIFMQSAPAANSIMNIYNNMVALNINMGSGGTFAYGIYLNYATIAGHQPNVHHNTVRLSGSILPGTANAIASACIAKGAVSDNWNCRNNIMVNECTGGAGLYLGMSASTPSTNNIQDHNCYNVTSGNLVRWSTTLYTSLATLTADVASCEINSTTSPVTFASATDLHLAGTSVGDQLLSGTLVSVPSIYGGSVNITTDFEDNARTSIPYMGADEASSPLPVSFLDIKALKKSDAVLVSWSTASETNNDFFLVERSFDGTAFDVISDNIKGSGNSNTINTYNYTDQLAKTNTQVIYYRIRQVDFDKKISFSKTVSIHNSVKKQQGVTALVFPNPVTDQSRVVYSLEATTKVRMVLYNILGQPVTVLKEELAAAGSYQAAIPQLAQGIYFLTIETEGHTETIRIISK
jgi:hypothetical protein